MGKIYVLMNGNTPCLAFSDDFEEYSVLDNHMLPYSLKDYINETGVLKGMYAIRDFLANRTLNLSRENAKVILNVANLPQTLKTDDRLKIVLACRGLMMEDNFWIKKDGEDLQFEDVCLREHKLSEKSYDIAILGHYISATRKELTPDLAAKGMFPKFWHREKDGVYLWKSDQLHGELAQAEVKASEYIRQAGGNALSYELREKDEKWFSVSKCFTDDDFSLLTASDLSDYFAHTEEKNDGMTLQQYVESSWQANFADMVVCDYVLANTDRHLENWGFLVNNHTQEITSFSPLYDMNQALLSDQMHASLDELIYQPTDTTYWEAVKQYALFSTVDFGRVPDLPEKCIKRWRQIQEFQRESSFSSKPSKITLE